MMIDAMTSSLPQVRGNTVKALAVLSQRRSPLAPEIPSMAESNVAELAQFEALAWTGMLAPAHVAPEIVGYWNEQANALLREPRFVERLRAMNVEAAPPGPARAPARADAGRAHALDAARARGEHPGDVAIAIEPSRDAFAVYGKEMLPAADNTQALPEHARAGLVGFCLGPIPAYFGGHETDAVHAGGSLDAEKIENGRPDIDDAGSAEWLHPRQGEPLRPE